jgi:serine/threonine protein kinase/dienelactone hydrolase
MKCPECQADNPSDSRFCKNCGSKIQSINGGSLSFTKTIQTKLKDLTTGAIFAERYKILGELGKGGMGIVYKAEDTKLKRTVALKFLPPEFTRDQEAKERFIREAQAAAALDHPNICTVYEVDEFEDQAYISMAYIEGYSLRDRLKKGQLSTEETLGIAIQIGEGLEEAHKKGIVHRDIKSANIMIDERGQAKIMDFGLAKVMGESLITKEPTTMGTVAYMSPEQTRGEAVDHRTDIWSFGVVLYEMFSGQLPFQGERETSIMYSIVHEKPPALKKINPNIPVDMERIISRALEKKPESRYSSAGEILKTLKSYQSSLMKDLKRPSNLIKIYQILRKPTIAIPILIAVTIIGYFAYRSYSRSAKIRWARNEAVPEIQRLIVESSGDATQWGKRIQAFELAKEAKKYIPENEELAQLWTRCSRAPKVETTPSGAKVYIKEYFDIDGEWEFVGITPVTDVRIPAAFLRWKFEKDGYEPVIAVASSWEEEIKRTLDKAGELPPGMVRVYGRETTEGFGRLNDFYVDKHEVTNQEFKDFVYSGGYQKPEYWTHEFVRDGKALSWKEALAEFVDTTGRSGPSTWTAGDYPDGKENYPVSGISWYEAAAYAEFAGKSLPSVVHWYMTAGFDLPSLQWYRSPIITLSNFGEEGPAPVGSYHGMSAFGAYDLAGNVREWCYNESDKGRYVRGGAWNDVPYMYGNRSQADAFDRSPKNGFRCIQYIDKGNILQAALEPVKYTESRDYYKEKPVSDEIFQVYKSQFQYDKSALNVEIENRDDSSEDWIKEKIIIDAAYADERVPIYLFLPKNTVPPYQTLIYVPGNNVIGDIKSDSLLNPFVYDFFIKNGRAVAYPIYKGTYERTGDHNLDQNWPTEEHQYIYTEYLIKWVKDFKRTIDYLQTREDIDSSKLAYYGFSWGGELGNIIPAVEDRLKVSVLHVGGFGDSFARPEADDINYVTRIKIPTLMLNGKYDMSFPYDFTVKPMFDFLGTPEEHKRLRVYETDHFIPRKELIRESLDWLDKYLGPVRRK